jgi:hypothetical protein
MNNLPREYSLPSSSAATVDGFFANSLFVRDQASPLSEQRLREHLDAVRARLVDRLGSLVSRGAAPTRREERELRFMLDELVEALHRLQSFGGGE